MTRLSRGGMMPVCSQVHEGGVAVKLQASNLKGIVPPTTTPLTDDDAIDREGVARLMDWFIDAGCTAIFALGSSGEGAALTREMRFDMIDA